MDTCSCSCPFCAAPTCWSFCAPRRRGPAGNQLGGKTPLDMVLVLRARDEACARVLVANGARLRRPSRLTPALRAFERGVLRCRSAVVAMLRVEHVGRLARWDKYLLVHLAVCVWCTRYATSDWSE